MPRRQDCEKLLKQKARVIWLTGLSGSGKSTLANALSAELLSRGFITCLLDGDIIRNTVNKDLGFSMDDRNENIRRTAEITKIMIDSGLIVITSFLSPTNAIREMAKHIIGKDDFIEIFIDCPLETCRRRDVKGLYLQADQGSLSNFTGVDSVYEPPLNPFLVINTVRMDIPESTGFLLNSILPRITYKPKTCDEAL
jgi:adenylylsulfate kinase